jgi:hypothetical protein
MVFSVFERWRDLPGENKKTSVGEQQSKAGLPVDSEAIEAIRGLIEELKAALGEKEFEGSPSVRKAMAVLARNSQERDNFSGRRDT